MASEARPINCYLHRQAATPKPCFVCWRPTPHVLVSTSVPNHDFLYTCLTHLTDSHFAKPIFIEPIQTVSKVKPTNQPVKSSTTPTTSSSNSDGGGVWKTVSQWVLPPSSSPSSSTQNSPSSTNTSQPKIHTKYTLDREFYALRVREWNTKQAQKTDCQLVLPRVPSNGLSK